MLQTEQERSVRIDLVLLFGKVAIADDADGGYLFFQFIPFSAAYLEVERTQVFLQVRNFGGAGNRDDPIGLVGEASRHAGSRCLRDF